MKKRFPVKVAAAWCAAVLGGSLGAGCLSATTGGSSSSSSSDTTSGGGSGGSTSSGASATSTGSGSSSGGPLWPLVPYHDGGVLAAPNVVLMTWANDPDQSVLEQYGTWIADGGYLPKVAGEYGVGNGTVQFVSLTNSAPTGSILDNPFPAYLDSHFASDPNMPPYAPNNLYVLVMPASWTDTSLFCQFFSGFHDHYLSSTGDAPLYAVIGHCSGSITSVETALSHEVVEGATDPVTSSWVFLDPTEPWFYLTGEVADLCESNSTTYTSGQFAASLVWSNEAAADGGVPCQPWPATRTYFSVRAPPTLATAPIGGQVQVTVTGWASGPFGSFELLSQDIQAVPVPQNGTFSFTLLFSTNPQFSSQTLTPGGTVTITLNVPSTAASGQSGAIWVLAVDPATGEYGGSAVVGVIAQ